MFSTFPAYNCSEEELTSWIFYCQSEYSLPSSENKCNETKLSNELRYDGFNSIHMEMVASQEDNSRCKLQGCKQKKTDI